nr:hypothetical protein B0A51_12483 [Rachicladosporium sp. CCFEE 5018]OQO20880.1 hypothetical protein B0A51_11342 [Rachicladosporium sp. CCFEE 5018]OQO23511.1 hypothetical protein B0A51_09504 [Rachicladosporium sp. CCFEE 5018]
MISNPISASPTPGRRSVLTKQLPIDPAHGLPVTTQPGTVPTEYDVCQAAPVQNRSAPLHQSTEQRSMWPTSTQMPQASAFAQLARHQESDGLYTVAASTSEAHGQEPVADPLLIWQAKPSLAHAVAAKNWPADIGSNGVPVSQRMPADPLAKKRNERGNLKYVESKDCVAIFDGGRAAKIMS